MNSRKSAAGQAISICEQHRKRGKSAVQMPPGLRLKSQVRGRGKTACCKTDLGARRKLFPVSRASGCVTRTFSSCYQFVQFGRRDELLCKAKNSVLMSLHQLARETAHPNCVFRLLVDVRKIVAEL